MPISPASTTRQLDRYEALLECADADLFDWITGRAAPPAEHDHDVTAPARSPSLNSRAPRRDECTRRSRALARRAAAPGHRCSARRKATTPPRSAIVVAERSCPPLAPCLPRRRPDGALCRRTRLLPSRARRADLPGLGLPALRPGIAEQRDRQPAHRHPDPAGDRRRRHAAGRADHGQRADPARAAAPASSTAAS